MNMKVGAATVDLSLPTGLPMGGYVARQQNAIGTSSAMTVRALVVERADTIAVILSFDLLYATASLTASIRSKITARYAIPGAAVLVCATHTHCGPRDITVRTDPSLADVLVDSAIAAVDGALNVKAASRAISGTSGSLGIGRNRRDRSGTVDDFAQLVLFEELSDGEPTGRVIASLVNAACHPTVLEGDTVTYDPDFVGPLRGNVEHALGGVCLYLQGFAGDTNPVYLSHTVQDARRVGALAAGPIIGALSTMLSTGRCASVINLSEQQPIAVIGGEGRINDGPLYCAAALIRADRKGDRNGAPPSKATESALEAEEWISQLHEENNAIFNSMDIVTTDAGPVPLEVQAILLGRDLAVIALPGEPLGVSRKRVATGLPGMNVLTVGYANGAPGYLPDERAFDDSGYEVGCSFVARGTVERLVDRALELAKVGLDSAR